MQIAIVQLSDIHLSQGVNEITPKLEKLADAICSTDPTCTVYIIVLSGDIANTGQAAEYASAKVLLNNLEVAITQRKPGSVLHYMSVPGNHDCFLPESEEEIRRVLCNAINATLQTAKPDAAILNALLQKQDDYFSFSSDLSGLPATNMDKIASRKTIVVGNKKLVFNLFNTSICSQRKERQDLVLPLEVVRQALDQEYEGDLSISVCHHPYQWLQADLGIAFRDYLEKISDLVLTGHQHHDDSYVKVRPEGEAIYFSEGAVLQERGNPRISGFNMILLNLEERKRRYATYHWSKTLYDLSHSGPWTEYRQTFANSSLPIPQHDFLAALSDSGVGLTHISKGLIPLDAVFVYPDASLRSFDNLNIEKAVGGTKLLEQLTKSNKILLNGVAYTGKTALIKTVAKEWLRSRICYPILLSGSAIVSSEQSGFERLIDAEIRTAYGPGSVTRYKQLRLDQKALLIDNWDLSTSDAGIREAFLRLAQSYFGRIVVCAQGISYVRQVFEKLRGEDVLLDFDIFTLKPMSYASRGVLIEKWISLDTPKESTEFTRRVEDTERTIRTVIGKNTLPSLPFIVLAILQAVQRDQDSLPENGSFGYLYEVLITTALNNSVDGKPQLDKKYTFLSRLAYHFFERGIDRLDVTSVKGLLSGYAKSFRIVIDEPALLKDLEHARVLIRQEGNYSFAYTHYFHYFLARYFKLNLNGPDGQKLRNTLNEFARGLNAGSNGIFLMFVIYLTHDEMLIDSLIRIGDEILAEVPESTLTDEVEFFNSKDHALLDRQVPSAINLEEQRQSRREAVDEARLIQKNGDSSVQMDLLTSSHGYSPNLPLETKFGYAIECIQILGQILRNFTGSLPGDRKLDILSTTYRLGLRTLRAILITLSNLAIVVRERLANDPSLVARGQELSKEMERLVAVLAELVGSGMFQVISTNIGSAEIEQQAYSETQDRIGKTKATELIDLAIRLDHVDEYPLAEIKRLSEELDSNRFAKRMLIDLVVSNMHVFNTGFEMRQKVASVLGIPVTSDMMRTDNKRLKKTTLDKPRPKRKKRK